MLLQLQNNPRPFGPLEIVVIAIFCIIVGAMMAFVFMRERSKLAAAALAPLAGTEAASTEPVKGGFKLRKIAPYLLFAGFTILFVLLFFALKHVPALNATPAAALPNPATGVLPDVDGATQDVKQATGGFVQIGGLFSKLLAMVIVFALFNFLPWDFQKLTHPGVANWKKEHYTDEFLALSSVEKFKESRGIGMARAIIAAAAILGVCVIQ